MLALILAIIPINAELILSKWQLMYMRSYILLTGSCRIESNTEHVFLA